MNNRYLFKAKRLDNGEWVTGHLITDEQDDSKCFIAYVFGTDEDGHPHDTDAVLVDNSTICQCTGLADKNGKMIWENDILEYMWDGEKRIDVIEYQPPLFTYTRSIRLSLEQDIVIGNRFDDPELLM